MQKGTLSKPCRMHSAQVGPSLKCCFHGPQVGQREKLRVSVNPGETASHVALLVARCVTEQDLQEIMYLITSVWHRTIVESVLGMLPNDLYISVEDWVYLF